MPDWNTVILAVIAMLNLITSLVAWHAHQETTKISQKVSEAAENIQKVEIATNSMKDQLVASTAKASQAEGELKGRADSRSEAVKPPTPKVT